MTVSILIGDALERLRELPDESVHCCITSPPYWGLRSYGGDPGMIGLEPTLDEHIANLVSVFREARRVLRSDGVCFLNYGDAYAGSWGNYHPGGNGGQRDKRTERWERPAWDDKNRRPPASSAAGFKPKDLMMLPARVAMALQADGWWLRSEIIWCLSGGVWLYARTQKSVGPMMLKDLARLDPGTVELWTGKKWTKVLAWTKSQVQGRKLELVLRSGERIGCTGNHVWPTARGEVAASELQIGDTLTSAWLPDNTSNPQWMNDDAHWFLGIYMAEGSMSGNTIQLSGHVKEGGRWERVKRLCEHYGASARLHEYANNQYINIDRGQALRAMIDTYIGGKGAYHKHFKLPLWELDNTSLYHVVMGYLEGDGHQDGPRWRLGFARNYALERDLRCLAGRLGAVLTLKPAKSEYQGGTRPTFRGEWRFSESEHHNAKNRNEIVEIRNSRARQFWDVTVEDESSLFALASGVLTHNSKPNPMPESVTDRPTSAHEKVFLLSKSPRYFYDAEAVRSTSNRADTSPPSKGRIEPSGFTRHKSDKQRGHSRRHDGLTDTWDAMPKDAQQATGANLRNVWTIATHAFPGSHFATFPPALVEPCIKAGTSARGVCGECGAPWARSVERNSNGVNPAAGRAQVDATGGAISGGTEQSTLGGMQASFSTTGWHPTCDCNASVQPAVCLDPFAGAGTVGLVAQRLGRDAVLIEINPEYAAMARKRIDVDQPGLVGLAV